MGVYTAVIVSICVFILVPFSIPYLKAAFECMRKALHCPERTPYNKALPCHAKQTPPLGPKTWPEKACILLLAAVFAAITSMLVSWINIEIGMFAAGSLGEQVQEVIAQDITNYIKGKIDPLRIYLQQGVRMWDEMGLDLSKWHDLSKSIPYQRAFLESYFDESRCCSAMFVNMHYDNNADGIDDSLSCHAIMAPECNGTATGSLKGEIAAKDLGGNAIWAGVLYYSDTYTNGHFPGLDRLNFTASSHSGDMVQVLPGKTQGAPDNTLSFRYYNFKRNIGDWHGDVDVLPGGMRDRYGNDVEQRGFVHWPISDGLWYRDIQLYELKKGEVRFAERVFPWTLYPPAVLKTHLFTPLFDSAGQQIGGWVSGFKLHWISSYLQKIAGTMDDLFVFIVERGTGVLVSTSDPEILLLRNYHTSATIEDTILAAECSDIRVSSIARGVMELTGAPKDDWNMVGNNLSRPDISTNKVSNKYFIVTHKLQYLGIDWVVVLSIPSKTIVADISKNAARNVIIILCVSTSMALLARIVQLFVLQWMNMYNPYDYRAHEQLELDYAADSEMSGKQIQESSASSSE